MKTYYYTGQGIFAIINAQTLNAAFELLIEKLEELQLDTEVSTEELHCASGQPASVICFSIGNNTDKAYIRPWKKGKLKDIRTK